MTRRGVVWLIVLALAFAGGPLLGLRPASAELVRWTDERGEVHIGALDDVPDRYKKFVKPLGAPVEPTASACLAARDAPKGGAKIRFKPNEYGKIIVHACVNGRGPIKMFLDTGAFATLISEELLRGFGVDFKDAYAIGVGGVTGGGAALVVKIESLQVEGARFGPMYITSARGWGGGQDIGGLLGQDFLKQFSLDIDNQRGVAVLTPKSQVGGAKPAPGPAPAAAPKADK